MVHIVELHADGTEEQLTQLPDDDMAEADGSTSSDAASAAAASADPLRLLLGRRASALTRSPRAPAPPHLPLLIDLSGGCGGVRFPLIATGSARFSWPPPVARAAADEDEAMDGGGVPRANTTPHAMRAHPSSTSLYDSFTDSGKRARPGGTAPSPCRGGVAAAMASSSPSSFATPPTFDSTDGLDGLVDGMLHVGASPAKRSRVTPVPLSAASILGLGAAGAAAVGAAPHPPAPPASRIGTPTPEPRNLVPPRAGAGGGGGGSGNDAPPPTPCGGPPPAAPFSGALGGDRKRRDRDGDVPQLPHIEGALAGLELREALEGGQAPKVLRVTPRKAGGPGSPESPPP